jgi:ATP-dependent RNA helicase SUPV3L1/SUV3
MLSFSAFKKSDDIVPETPDNKNAKAPAPTHPLDTLTGGAFSAPTSGERSAKVREWLASQPSAEQMQEVFKELSVRDKGAAKPLREKLDDIKRSASQEHIAQEWAHKAQALLDASKLNIADALAWQRDAAKAGAPLSKEPLASLRAGLTERVKAIEDLQHRAQVQREAAIMMAQRIELLSTKPLSDAQAAFETLHVDVKHWSEQTTALQTDPHWASVDAKFTPQLDTAQSQLHTLWEAFSAALAQATAATADATAALPAVPVWAESIRAARGEAVEKRADKPVKPKVDPEKRQAANAAVREQLSKLEQELAEGHGKASAQAANDLRAALKDHGAFLDDRIEAKARDALGAAGEMEGWQKWRANQIREELIIKAQALVAKPLGGRKQQEAVRSLRDAWKQTDQGGMPNHGMWRKFDEACNEAHKIVEAWLDKVKAEEGAHKAQRVAIIEEIQNWSAANSARTDWKLVDRELHQLAEKWRGAGHIGEKTFAELQPQYKAAIKAAHGPLEVAQKASLERRRALIEEAKELGAAPMMRIDAVKSLQGRWQAEAQSVPMDRKEEQKLWDAFRKPIDEAFERKGKAREEQAAAMSHHDKAVLDATKALDAAIASNDAKAIRNAMDALDAAGRGRAVPAAAPVAAATPALASAAESAAPAADHSEPNEPVAPVESTQFATESIANEAAPADATVPEASAEAAEVSSPDAVDGEASTPPSAAPVVAEPPKALPKPVVARRGDDRPGAKLGAPAKPEAGRFGDKRGGDRRDGKFGDKKPGGFGDKKPGGFGDRRPDSRSPAGPGGAGFGGRDGNRDSGRDSRGSGFGAGRSDDRFEDRGPRLSNTAFYALRDGMDKAQMALKKLAAQAHGESVVGLLTAWEGRNAEAIPTAQQLGRSLQPAARAQWTQALAKPAAGDATTALLRLEMAAEVPTPAEQLDARRMLQLQLLTKRGEAAPKDTWQQDAAAVLATAHDEKNARRLQNALKALLR